MMFIRPLVIILVFFAGLFVLREPIRHLDENLAVVKHQYIDPIFKHEGSADLNTASSTSPSDLAYGTSTIGSTLGASSTRPYDPALPAVQGGSKEPLVSKNDSLTAEVSSLSISGVLAATNKERTSRKVGALKINSNLNKAANEKLQDMFTNQYFQHVSPEGIDVSNLIRGVGYEYIVVGENLALGNFGGDVQVVTAWMNSPGHRANILDRRFQEIGIAVGKGKFNGKEQWIAVQHFAKPLSSCEGPSADLKAKVDAHTAELSVREGELNTLKKKIETSNNAGSVPYQADVEKYNNLVGDYNTRLEGLKDEIATYNAQVRFFNTCAGLTTSNS